MPEEPKKKSDTGRIKSALQSHKDAINNLDSKFSQRVRAVLRKGKQNEKQPNNLNILFIILFAIAILISVFSIFKVMSQQTTIETLVLEKESDKQELQKRDEVMDQQLKLIQEFKKGIQSNQQSDLESLLHIHEKVKALESELKKNQSLLGNEGSEPLAADPVDVVPEEQVNEEPKVIKSASGKTYSKFRNKKTKEIIDLSQFPEEYRARFLKNNEFYEPVE